MSSGSFRALGYAMIIIGIIVTIMAGDKITSGGMFSSGRDFGSGELIAIFLIAFYHIASVLLCFGVASCLDANASEQPSVDKDQPVDETDDPEDPWE